MSRGHVTSDPESAASARSLSAVLDNKCLRLQVKDERKAQEVFHLADYERCEELRKAGSRSKKNHSRFVLLRRKRPANTVGPRAAPPAPALTASRAGGAGTLPLWIDSDPGRRQGSAQARLGPLGPPRFLGAPALLKARACACEQCVFSALLAAFRLRPRQG